MTNVKRLVITKEQHAFIAMHQRDITRAELTARFNAEFDTSVSTERLRSYAKRKKLNRVIKTMINCDKQQQWIADNQAELSRQQLTERFNNTFGTSFKTAQLTAYCRRKGLQANQVIRNRKPIGTISRQGKFLHIKTDNPDAWQPLHRIQYESYHGKKIPDGFMIVFADGDCDNIERNNLVCVHESISIVINHRHRANTASPKLNKAIMLTASLHALSKE